MKRSVFFLLIIAMFVCCVPKAPPQTNGIVDLTTVEEIIILPNEMTIHEELITQVNQDIQQNISIERNIVSLPFEMAINENNSLIIKKNGIVEFGDKMFIWKIPNEGDPFEDDISLTIYSKNNLFGINISVQYFSGGSAPYTIVINKETQEEILFDKYPDILVLFRNFFSIGNHFILAFDQRAYAFNDLTGELLWTQRYNLRSGVRIFVSDDHFIVDDIDGNVYKIFGDGRKEIV